MRYTCLSLMVIVTLLLTDMATAFAAETEKAPLTYRPEVYSQMLGKGMDVDWSKTKDGNSFYNVQTVKDFKAAGVSHVRIRISADATEALLDSLEQQIDDCINVGLIPIIAFQADAFKNNPSEAEMNKVVEWWSIVSRRYKDKSNLLSFDLLIEATDALNKSSEPLNKLYEACVSEIRKTNPNRIIFISPRLRSDPAYLNELKLPTKHNGYVMAEWHFYASGPSKTNSTKQWTTGTEKEKKIVLDKIKLALDWQKKTGIRTWIGAWMPGNYNEENNYTISEQIAFASFVTKSLEEAKIPFAINSDTKFYDRELNRWIENMVPVFKSIFYSKGVKKP